MTVTLGMPTIPPQPLATRRRSRQIRVGSVPVGGDAPISVQSATQAVPVNLDVPVEQAIAPEKAVVEAPAKQAPSEFEAVIAEAAGVEAPKVLDALKPVLTSENETEPQVETLPKGAPAVAKNAVGV